MEFKAMQKIPRLSRDCVITEKLDGTNASVLIGEAGEFFTGSRTRWITPEQDNYGFAAWAHAHREELMLLGPGHHFGEWWGAGCQRRYGLTEKRFSLFNTARWLDAPRPACVHLVPVLYSGPFTTEAVEQAVARLAAEGSVAAPGFMDPEGVIVYHEASGALFKKTVKGDEAGKHQDGQVVVPRPPRPQKDPSKGGRRLAQVPIMFLDRRKPK